MRLQNSNNAKMFDLKRTLSSPHDGSRQLPAKRISFVRDIDEAPPCAGGLFISASEKARRIPSKIPMGKTIWLLTLPAAAANLLCGK